MEGTGQRDIEVRKDEGISSVAHDVCHRSVRMNAVESPISIWDRLPWHTSKCNLMAEHPLANCIPDISTALAEEDFHPRSAAELV